MLGGPYFMGKEITKKSFYKHWWLWLIVLILIGAGAVAIGGEDVINGGKTEEESADKESTSENDQVKENTHESTKEKSEMPGIGESVKVGDVVYTINGKSIEGTIGEVVSVDAKDVYLVLGLTVKNEKNEPILVDSTFFKLISGNTEYEADAEAVIYANGSSTLFLEDLNPGIESKGKIVFDLPENIANSQDLMVQVQTDFQGSETGKIRLTE